MIIQLQAKLAEHEVSMSKAATVGFTLQQELEICRQLLESAKIENRGLKVENDGLRQALAQQVCVCVCTFAFGKRAK